MAKGLQAEIKTDVKEVPRIPRLLKPHKSKKAVPKDNHIADAIISIAGVAMIIPCIFYGVIVFIGTGFKSALEASLKMYNDVMRDAEKWSK